MKKNEKFGKKRVNEEDKRKNVIILVLIILIVLILFIGITSVVITNSNKKENKVDETVSIKKEVPKNQVDNSDDDSDKVKRDKDKVIISVDDESLTEDGAVIIIKDTNKNKYIWTPGYKIQIKVDGKWEDMKLLNPENAFFNEREIENPTGTIQQSLVWVNKYGKLEKGQYRIVKTSDDTDFYATFEIK